MSEKIGAGLIVLSVVLPLAVGVVALSCSFAVWSVHTLLRVVAGG